MPWHVEKQGKRFTCVKADGTSVGCSHPSRKAAQKHVAAMYANTEE